MTSESDSTGATIADSAVRAFRWLAAAQIIGQVFTWASTILVIRLLEPADYGLMAMAGVFIELLMLFREIGISAALIQRKELGLNLRRQALGILISLNVGMYALLLLGHQAIAGWFESPQLELILVVMGLPLLLMPFGMLGDAQLRRALNYRPKALIEFASMLVGAALSLGLAFSGVGVWALVAGATGTHCVRMLGLAWVGGGFIRPSFRFEGSGDLVRFGAPVLGERLLWWAYEQSDRFVAAKLLGKEPLGYYGVAMQLASLPMQRLAVVLNDVGLSALSRLQERPDEARQRFLQIVQFASFFGFSVFWGIAAVAPELVAVILGEKWQPVAPLLVLLAAIMPLRMLAVTFPPMLVASGHPKVSMYARGLGLLLFPPAFIVGALNAGIEGVVWAWVLVFPGYFLAQALMTLRTINCRYSDFARALGWAPLVALLMWVVLGLLRPQLAAIGMSGLFQLLVLVAIGALTFLGVMGVVDRPLLRSVIRRIRK